MALSILTCTVSCANDNKPDTSRPVETKKPNTRYKPAFAGQTRIQGLRTATAYKVDKLAEKLGRPWAVIPMPDGRLLITEKSGYMMILNAKGGLVKKITGLPAVDEAAEGRPRLAP